MASGVEDDGTLRANREGFQHIQLRPRRLRDATKVDMRVSLLGTTYNSPIFTCPTGGEKSFFPDGEVAVARADKAYGTLQFLSTVTSSPVEEVNKALGRPVWQQLYAPSTWEACQKILERVISASQGRALIAEGVATGGMQAKLNAALAALAGGVGQVRIAAGAADRVLERILAGEDLGTRLAADGGFE